MSSLFLDFPGFLHLEPRETEPLHHGPEYEVNQPVLVPGVEVGGALPQGQRQVDQAAGQTGLGDLAGLRLHPSTLGRDSSPSVEMGFSDTVKTQYIIETVKTLDEGKKYL